MTSELTLQLTPVIMAGGSGTRLWPLSRLQYPKQFLPIAPGGQTMLQATVQRLEGLSVAAPLLICNEEHRFLAAEQLRAMGHDGARILLEPVGRNTAPAIALAALQATQGGADAVLLVLAADHVIPDVAAFQRCIQMALPLAQAGKLVTCGVVATQPETGYGYIERGAPLGDTGAFAVGRFVEKPDAATARAYLESGRYLWNSGMFVFKASVYLRELGRFAPEMLRACQAAMAGATQDMTFVRVDKTAFDACPSDSVDYAVMEKTTDAVVVPLEAQWSDVGAWSSFWEISDKDEHGNVFTGDVVAVDTENTFVRGDRLIATVGLRDVVVIETPDAILVADRHQIQQVKDVVARLKAANRRETDLHRKVARPWGWFDSIDAGPRFQVKRIVVHPGGVLSLQMHHHRAEHWIVVSGTARVTRGDESFLLAENQSTYIPLGVTHRLENPGRLQLEMIEVQSGSYLGEDDIVRFEDNYGRAPQAGCGPGG